MATKKKAGGKRKGGKRKGGNGKVGGFGTASRKSAI